VFRVARFVVVALAQKPDVKSNTEAEVANEIRQTIGASILAKSWTVNHITFLEDYVTQEKVKS